MSKQGKMKAEKLFAETQKKTNDAANKQAREQAQRREHAASLKARRLAKKVIDEQTAAAEKAEKAKKAATKKTSKRAP